MPGLCCLVPGIHGLNLKLQSAVDGRDKPGHDVETNGNESSCAGRGPRRAEMLILALSCVAALLATAALAVALGRTASASPIVYAASLAASFVLLAGALARLVADPGQVSTLTLPIGLPGLGAHFRLDALSAFYLVMASFGTLALLLAFGLLAGPAGAYAFDAMRAAHPGTAVAAIALVLVLVGAGSKAGVYGFVRIVFDLIGTPPWWTSIIVLAFAGLTTVLGVLYALMQHDLKRLLAYHTVENIGIIYIGLGLAIAFQQNGIAWAAALALTAALFHVLNHSLFKSLLFFGAGAVLSATHERDMERLGGLIHRMPHTAVAFLIGCAAISALPPLNGFVSEWLTFQAILVSPQLPQWGLKLMVPAVGALLALSAALAATCFVKAFGITFLGRPRTGAVEAAREVDRISVAVMFAFALLCFLAGILPGLIIDRLGPVVHGLVGEMLPPQSGLAWLSIVPIAAGRSSYNGMILLIFLASSATLTAIFIHRFATRATRRSAIWDCGYPQSSPATEYTSSSFAMPIRRVFGSTVFAVREKLDMPAPGETRAGHFQVKVFDPAWRYAYGPLVRAAMKTADRLNPLQFLTIRRYLTLTFSALILLLIVVAAWR